MSQAPYFKNIFSAFKKVLKNFAPKKEELAELYSLNKGQLKNLVDKNIQFGFFQLEDFSIPCDPKTKALLKKAKRVTKKKLWLSLKNQDLKQPVVLICAKGLVSKKMSQKLRDKKFVNVYFVEGGLKGLLSSPLE